ncbi:hypothetical protein FM106_00010 [Brachybacterium faecium]|nr:hypothetical protein FM106_00010 [Brachybacterium faecium]
MRATRAHRLCHLPRPRPRRRAATKEYAPMRTRTPCAARPWLTNDPFDHRR